MTPQLIFISPNSIEADEYKRQIIEMGHFVMVAPTHLENQNGEILERVVAKADFLLLLPGGGDSGSRNYLYSWANNHVIPIARTLVELRSMLVAKNEGENLVKSCRRDCGVEAKCTADQPCVYRRMPDQEISQVELLLTSFEALQTSVERYVEGEVGGPVKRFRTIQCIVGDEGVLLQNIISGLNEMIDAFRSVTRNVTNQNSTPPDGMPAETAAGNGDAGGPR